MAKTNTSKRRVKQAADPAPPGRIDSPHTIKDRGPRVESAEARSAEATEVSVSELLAEGNSARIANQAIQLSEHLRERQQELELVESRLNELQAKLREEHDTTAATIRTREAEAQRLETDLHQREQQLARRWEQCEALAKKQQASAGEAEQDLQRRLAENDSARSEIALREASIAKRETALRVARDRLDEQRSQQIRELRFEQQKLQAQLVRLMEMRRRVTANAARAGEGQPARPEPTQTLRYFQDMEEHRRELADAARRIREERAAFEKWRHQERKRLEERARQLQATESDAERRVSQQRKDVRQQQAAIAATREEVAAIHRETLESRLAIQQLWSQTVQDRSPTELTQALSQIRVQVSDHFRRETGLLDTRRAELKEFGIRLGQKCRDLEQQKAQLIAWNDSQQRHLEKDATRLVAREQELHEADQQYRQLQVDWQKEKLDLQQQIRQLHLRLG